MSSVSNNDKYSNSILLHTAVSWLVRYGVVLVYVVGISYIAVDFVEPPIEYTAIRGFFNLVTPVYLYTFFFSFIHLFILAYRYMFQLVFLSFFLTFFILFYDTYFIIFSQVL